MHQLQLLFGVHAHQPVGNFPSVIDQAHVRCYGMFLRVLARYPAFRCSMHFSGWLLEQLQQRHPADMALLAKMSARGQVEWFGGGDCEPVLAAIPQRDRITQLNALSARIQQHYGQRPRGVWLTERVWEAAVVSALAASGARYAVVDDYNFLCTGLPSEALDSYYTTEEAGQRMDLFPLSEDLRYRLPFSPAHEAVAHLENLAQQNRQAAIYFDDIEKFGIWPETYAWVYEQGWLAQFIEGVLASPHIRTTHFADYHAQTSTRGIVYLPTASYFEMNEWTLHTPAAVCFNQLVAHEKQLGRYTHSKPFLRGGIWRNFLSRYAEANWMHKRMLQLSIRLAELAKQTETASAPTTPIAPAPIATNAQIEAWQALLHRAQANDAYWHGLFGGLYLPHLRRSVWRHLLALEAALDQFQPRPPSAHSDIDCDGHTEARMSSNTLQAFARTTGDACLIEFDSYPLQHNFADTLRRHSETYHHTIAAHLARHGLTQVQADNAADADQAPRSAHERIAFKHDIHVDDIQPDTRPRGLFVDTLHDHVGQEHALQNYRLQAATAHSLHFSTTCGSLRIDKHYRLNEQLLTVEYRLSQLAKTVQMGDGDAHGDVEHEFEHEQKAAATSCQALAIQLNLAMPSCDGAAGRYRLPDGTLPCGFGEHLQLDEVAQLMLEDDELPGMLQLNCDHPVQLTAWPHQTVSQSEAGFEKIMQAACLTIRWQPPAISQTRPTASLWLALSVEPTQNRQDAGETHEAHGTPATAARQRTGKTDTA